MQRILKPEIQGAISKLEDEMALLRTVMVCDGLGAPSNLRKYDEKKILKSELISDRKNWILVDHGEFWDLK